MRPSLQRLLGLVAALAAAALPFLGSSAVWSPPVRGGPPPARVWQRDCAGKPGPAVGQMGLWVLDRPTRDSALIQADWRQGGLAEKGPASLEVVLPDGVFLSQGAAKVSVPQGLAGGSDTWLVRFPTDRTSDLAVRLRVDTEDGPQVREFYLRLWEVADQD